MITYDDIIEDTDSESSDDSCSIYKLSDNLLSGDNLLDAEYTYDETGVYVPYTAKYQAIGCKNIDGVFYNYEDHQNSGSRFLTEDDIYLKIHRVEDTKAAILIKCTWVRKVNNEYVPFNSFNIECTWGEILDKYAKLDTNGNIKSNKLNQKASATGRDAMLPASDGSYVNFIDDVRRDILLAPCLEVLKDKNYEWPEIPDEDEEDIVNVPQCFSDYP